MKRLYFIAFLIIGFSAFSQIKDYYYNSWRLGLNLGGMWQTSDMSRNNAGFAAGFTLEKGILENKTHFFSLAIRGRGLFGNTYGYSGKKNYNVSTNPALNGSYNSSVNYTDTVGGPKFFVYNNYKTQISEGALELQISFNELRERTHVILNLWGGVGFSVYRANTNLLDANNKMYNFSKVDSTGSSNNVVLSQKSLLDKSYESYAQGSKNGDLFTFSPSVGIGLGYQFNSNFSILFEYKITFPQGMNADLLDGHIDINKNWTGTNNDFYHYAGVNFLFTLGRGHKAKSESHPVTSNYTPATTNTVITNNQVPPPTNTVGVSTGNVNPAFSKPIVTITNPGYSPYNSNSSSFEVQAKVYNVSARSQLNIQYNGGAVNNYYFSGNDLSFLVNLLQGNNSVIITAANQSHSDSKSATINYQGNPPVINISNPVSSPYNTTSDAANINASVFNVASANDIQVKLNGNIITSFSYNAQNNQLSLPVNLINGNNTFEIVASNNFGNDSKALNIIYTKPVEVSNIIIGKPLGLIITDPSVNPFTVKVNYYAVKAKAEGVNTVGQIAVTVNGSGTPFNFDNNTGIISFNAPLVLGSNGITVTAKNGKSNTSKSTTIIYEDIIKTKVICFKSGENANSETITILESEWPAYQAKGAYEGPCKSKSGTEGNVTTDPEIVICHRRINGVTQTMTILQSQWPAHQSHGDILGDCPKIVAQPKEIDEDHNITICHKNDNGSKQTIVILQSQWAQHLAHGDAMGTCPITTGDGGSVNPDPLITICHKNDDGSKQSISIRQSQWASHQAHGDAMGACVGNSSSGGDPNEMIKICHKNTDGSRQNMNILLSTWPSHQAHGDHLGYCTQQELDPNITICHIPPGNPNNPQTITISQSSWPAHQAHGDSMGACPENKVIKGGGDSGGDQPKKETEQKTDGGQSAPRTIKGGDAKPETGKSEPKTDGGDAGKLVKPR